LWKLRERQTDTERDTQRERQTETERDTENDRQSRTTEYQW